MPKTPDHISPGVSWLKSKKGAIFPNLEKESFHIFHHVAVAWCRAWHGHRFGFFSVYLFLKINNKHWLKFFFPNMQNWTECCYLVKFKWLYCIIFLFEWGKNEVEQNAAHFMWNSFLFRLSERIAHSTTVFMWAPIWWRKWLNSETNMRLSVMSVEKASRSAWKWLKTR